MRPAPRTVPAPQPASGLPPGAPRLRLPALLRALRHRNYRLFFGGQIVSLTGTWMQSVAQGWLVLRLTDSPGWLGVVAAAMSVPALLFSLPAGTLADRLPRRSVLVTTQTCAMLLALTMALLTFSGRIQVWHIILLAALLGVVNAFDAPTRQAFTIEMVGRDDLLNAIALNSSMFNTARTLGPAVAGIVVATVGEATAFLVNGLSYTAVIVSLLLIRLPPFTPPPRTRQGQQLREGLGYAAREPVVRMLLLAVGSMMLFGFAYFHLLPVFARDVLHTDARGLGALSASQGAGALLAALLLAQFSTQMPRGRVLTGAALLFPLFLIGFTMARSLPLAMLLLALIGWSGVTSLALANTLIQTLVPDELRGRVLSIYTMLLLGLGPLGALIVGGIAQIVGQVPLVVGSSAAVAWLIMLTAMIRVPALRAL